MLSPTTADRILAGRYRVVRSLGEGAHGKTLLCLDEKTDSQVAIKALHVERLDSWKHVELFEREAKVLRLVSHPGVPRVLDSFEHEEDGRVALYLVQEYIEGQTLRERMEVGPLLGESELFAIADGVLEILAHLHSRVPPVIHRDIKPSNVMVRPDGTPALIDFGGVCFGWRRPEQLGSTVVGTFGYMPPEQLLGQIGPRTDLYALGATLLHVATGTPPHEFSFETGRIEVPTDIPVRPRLRALIHALLEPAPRDRPASAEAARALLVDGAPAGAPKQAAAPASAGALALPAPTGLAVLAGDAPQYVDVGPPPRDPDGPHAEVYRALVDPHNDLHRRGVVTKLGILAGLGFIAVFTLGIFPLWWVYDRRRRRERYDPLFRNGAMVCGTLATVIRHGEGHMYATFKFDYDVDGVRYRGFMHYPEALTRYFSEGDPVTVLYDPADPTDSCFVYRPSPRR